MRILPRLTDTFLGREKELERLREFFSLHHLFILKGIGGIGKTTLALALLEGLKKQGLEKSVFWIECLEGWRLEDFFLEVDSWLKKSGEQGFSSWIEGQKKDLKEKVLFLINILNEKKFILFIDDFHLLQDENINMFLNLLHTYLNSKIIFISREDMPVSHFEKLDIFEEKLEGLPVDTATNLLKNLLNLHKLVTQPDNKSLAKAAEKVGGHPLLLKLVASSIIARSLDIQKIFSEGAPGEIEDYLFSNILNKVSPEERKILDILALNNIPIAEDAIKAILKIKDIEKITASLQKKFLLDRDASGSLFIHQFIAQYLANNVDEDLKRSLHRKLGTYFEKIGLQQEAFSHFLEGNEPPKASEILTSSAEKMCSLGQYELLIKDSNRLEKFGAEVSPRVLIMKANALSILGKWKESLAVLQKVENITTDRATAAESIAFMAGVYFKAGNIEKALSLYEKSLKLLNSSSQSHITIICLSNIALIYGLRGEISRGRKYLQRSLELSFRENNKLPCSKLQGIPSGKFVLRHDTPQQDCGVFRSQNKELLANALRIKGIIHNRAGEYDASLKTANEAFKLASDTASAYLLGRIKIVMGNAYLGIGKYDEAKAIFEETLLESKKLGDIMVTGAALVSLGEIARERGDYREAAEAFNAASRSLIEHENLLNNAITHYELALNLIDEGKEEAAITFLEKSLETMKEFAYYKLEAEILLKLSEIYLNKGNIDKASDLSSKALSLLEKLELPKLKADACLCLAEIFLRRQNELEAKKHVENCFHLLEINKYPEEFHRAYYILSAISSENKSEKKKNAMKANKLLENLSGSRKRNAERFLQRFKSILSRKFCIYLKDKEYIANETDAEHLRANKGSYEFFMDIPKEQLFIRGVGEVDIFRKKILSTLLYFLVLNAGKGFTFEELFTSVWGYKIEEEKSAEDVRTSISRLRLLIEPDRKNPRFIKHSKLFMNEKGKYYFENDINFCLIRQQSFKDKECSSAI